MFVAGFTAPAYAQDADAPQVEESVSSDIIVTGSRIRGIEPIGSPVVGLGREEMELSAGTTTTELLSELPQVFNLGAPDASFTAANNQSANRTFGTGVNLRGLGTESTLTLLDGRRLPAAGTQSQYFDPSVIQTVRAGRREMLRPFFHAVITAPFLSASIKFWWKAPAEHANGRSHRERQRYGPRPDLTGKSA